MQTWVAVTIIFASLAAGTLAVGWISWIIIERKIASDEKKAKAKIANWEQYF